MRALGIAAFLFACVVNAQETPEAEGIWHSPAPENKSSSRWVCGLIGGNTIEFRFYPSLVEERGLYAWIVRQGQTFAYAMMNRRGLETYFFLQGSSHEIRIGADRIARYFPFSGQEGERIVPSASWYGCQETR